MEFGWEWFCLQICETSAGLPVEACASPQSPLFSLFLVRLPPPEGAAVSCQGPALGLHSQGFPVAPDPQLSARTTYMLHLGDVSSFTLTISSWSQELRANLTPLVHESEPCHTCSDRFNPCLAGVGLSDRDSQCSLTRAVLTEAQSWGLSYTLLFQNGNVLIACFIFMTL